MTEAVDLHEKLAALEGPFDPRIVATLNDYKVQVVRVQGEFVWHAHPDTDDFFLVLGGQLTIQLRDGDISLGPGQLYVVPAGVEHCPRSEEGADVLLIEPLGTPNTGDAEGDRTKPERGA
jgi:mannose-6-phosphate isomerase-like protein (cupin superfamily)